MADIEFTDRYKALGIPYPELSTMCRGDCEGTGYVPIFNPHKADGLKQAGERVVYIALWEDAEAAHLSDDGWHFVKCPDCMGTGKRPASP